MTLLGFGIVSIVMAGFVYFAGPVVLASAEAAILEAFAR